MIPNGKILSPEGSLLDTIAPLHYGAPMNRLTITLPDDLYAMARAHAVANRKSLSKAIADLMQGRLRAEPPAGIPTPDAPVPDLHPRSGFPIVADDGRPITSEDVRRAEDDEDIRHLEMMGLSPDQIARSMAR